MTENFCDDCMARPNNTSTPSGCGAGGWNAGAWTLGGNQQNPMNQQAPIPQSYMMQPTGTITGAPMGTTAGVPTGTTSGNIAAQQPSFNFPSPIPGADFVQAPGSPVFQGEGYTQGFLRRNIGKNMRVEFLIGTNLLTDRVGTLIEVGISYIVLRPADSDDQLMCDIYSIVFVTVFQ